LIKPTAKSLAKDEKVLDEDEMGEIFIGEENLILLLGASIRFFLNAALSR
jgi:hypothetical protein